MARRVLIITAYYLDWHPAPAVLRVKGIERFLRERGYRVDVFHFAGKGRGKGRGRMREIFRWVGWPDSMLGKVVANMGKLRRMLRSTNPDAVYITSPPFSTLLLLPLIDRPAMVEMRDVWSYDRILRMYRTPIQRWLSKLWEGYAMRKAHTVITLNENQMEYLSRTHGIPPNRFALLPHFYLPLQVKDCTPQDSPLLRVCYMGTADWMKGLEKVLPAMSRMTEIKPVIRGEVKGISPEGAEIFPPLPHTEAIEWACRHCDVMWVSLDRFEGHHLITSSKAKTYLSMGRPILATIPMDNPMASHFEQVEGIYMADIDREGEILKTLKRLVEDWKANRLMKPENPQIFRYDRVLMGLDEILSKI